MITRTGIQRMFPCKPRTVRQATAQRRPRLEALECRLTPTTFNPLPNAVDGAAGSLRAAIEAANHNSDVSNTINLTAGTYTLTDVVNGDLLIVNANNRVQAKTLVIHGLGSTASFVSGSEGWQDRIFNIIGSPGKVVVSLDNLAITKGHALKGNNGTKLGAVAAVGGGLLIQGGDVTLDHVLVKSNAAKGQDGHATGDPDAMGGGIFLETGTLKVIDSTIQDNSAIGGIGANGTPDATGAVGSNGAKGSNGTNGGHGGNGTNGANGTFFDWNGDPGKDGTKGGNDGVWRWNSRQTTGLPSSVGVHGRRQRGEPARGVALCPL